MHLENTKSQAATQALYKSSLLRLPIKTENGAPLPNINKCSLSGFQEIASKCTMTCTDLKHTFFPVDDACY